MKKVVATAACAALMVCLTACASSPNADSSNTENNLLESNAENNFLGEWYLPSAPAAVFVFEPNGEASVLDLPDECTCAWEETSDSTILVTLACTSELTAEQETDQLTMSYVVGENGEEYLIDEFENTYYRSQSEANESVISSLEGLWVLGEGQDQGPGNDRGWTFPEYLVFNAGGTGTIDGTDMNWYIEDGTLNIMYKWSKDYQYSISDSTLTLIDGSYERTYYRK